VIHVQDSWRQTRARRIVAAIFSAAGARVLSSLVTLLALPLAVRYLGPERFGLYATVTSTVVFLNLLDLGIASTLTNHIARSYAVGDKTYAARYTGNALTLTCLIAAATAAGLCLLWPRFDWSVLFNVRASLARTEVGQTVAAATALILMGLPASLGARIFAGYQQVYMGNVVLAVGTLANLAGLLLGVALHVSMPLLLLLGTGGITLANLAGLAALLLWLKPWLRPRFNLLSRTTAQDLLSSGWGFLLIQIAGAIVFSSDNVVVSHYLGPAQVTPYNVTWRLVGLTAVMQGLIFPALWPAYAEAYARGDYTCMRNTFRLTLRGTLACNVGLGLLLIAVGRPLIRWWAGAAAVPSMTLLIAMSFWGVLSGCMTVESCLLAAVNRTREQGILSVVAAALNLALSIFLVQRIGAVGVIAGTILSYLLVLVVPQSLIVKNVLNAGASNARRPSNPTLEPVSLD
jgi:O-antigen/teichoic acid export membrane protein